MAVLPTDYTDSSTPTGATTELPATTTRGVNAITTQINTNTTAIAGKEPTISAGTSAQYWRGDKSWQTLSRVAVPETGTVSSAASLTLTTASSAYIFSGSSPSVWTLPAVSGNTGFPLILANRGSATVTVQRAGTDNIYGVGGVLTSLGLTAGSEIQLFNDGTYWVLMSYPVTALNATGTASSATYLRGDGSWSGPPADFILVQVGNVARAVGSGDFAVGHRVGRAFTATSVIYQFDTADASGSTTVELRRNGTQVTSSSVAVTAANQADGTGTDAARTVTISQAFAAGDRINLQITAVGTTPGTGLRAWIVGTWN